jgi:hypothetical protein
MSRRYRSKEQAHAYWQEDLKQWQESGLSIHRFCREHHISESGFYTWRKKLALTQTTTSTNSDKSTDSPFIQVDMHPTPQSQLTLQLVSGHTLHITNQVDSDALVKVIGALQEAKLC